MAAVEESLAAHLKPSYCPPNRQGHFFASYASYEAVSVVDQWSRGILAFPSQDQGYTQRFSYLAFWDEAPVIFPGRLVERGLSLQDDPNRRLFNRQWEPILIAIETS
ncbi:hypothetical protein ABG768_018590 [Culter alburnus]|uniref:RES domain-containing protein n=1 Tax=Culter alburnus TaxID=194366 RepID=A0AAW1YW54_CULAL